MDAPYDVATGRVESVSFQLFSTAWARAVAWIAERREIAAVTWRLEGLGERELADIGISRAEIPTVARGAQRRGT